MFDATGLFRIYAAWRGRRLRRLSAAAAQRRILLRLVRRAARTRFGRDHDFAGVRDIAGFQRRTPLRDYEDFWRDYWGEAFPELRDVSWPGLIPFYALTSGTTTGESKYIPYTPEKGRAAVRGMADLLVHHVQASPRSRLLGGEALALTGPEELTELAPGVRAGAVSALSSLRTPLWLRRRMLPPPEIAAIEDWREKIRALAPVALRHDLRGLGGSPNWLLMFLDEVAANRPDAPRRLSAWWPGLELIVHGGVNFAPYRARFRAMLEGGRAETREVYSASEGFFAVADRGDGEGLRLIADGAVFYEFIPVDQLDAPDPPRRWVGDIETGADYAVAVSTPAGLWSYLVGDTVRFVSTDPPRLLVTGRTSYLLSAFGEHLIEAELAEAVAAAAAEIGTSVVEYAVAAKVGEDGQPGGWHDYVVECAPPPGDDAARERFAAALDARLCALNADYRELRARDYNIRPPRIRFAPPGGFEAWMKLRRHLGGQNKAPRVVRDAALFADLAGFMEARR